MLQERLLDVAVDHFGRLGFEGANTRDIAASAGTAMSSITYHFGGKEGLYLACADHIAKRIWERQAGVFATAGQPEALSSDEAAQHLVAFMDGIAEMMLAPESAAWSRFVVREQADPSEAFERLWQGAMGPGLEKACALLERIQPDLGKKERHAKLMVLFGQALVLRTARACVCRSLGVEKIGRSEARILRQQVRQSTLTILTAETGILEGTGQ